MTPDWEGARGNRCQRVPPTEFRGLYPNLQSCPTREVRAQQTLEYTVTCEGHRIENVDFILPETAQSFTSHARLLIAGIPLQNNLKELAS